MALPLWGLRRFRYARYFGDGVYPTIPKFFVLTDQVTGLLYRITAPNAVVTLVQTAGLTNADIKEDAMTVLDLRTNKFVNLTIKNGNFAIVPPSPRTREAQVPDAGNIYVLGIHPVSGAVVVI